MFRKLKRLTTVLESFAMPATRRIVNKCRIRVTRSSHEGACIYRHASSRKPSFRPQASPTTLDAVADPVAYRPDQDLLRQAAVQHSLYVRGVLNDDFPFPYFVQLVLSLERAYFPTGANFLPSTTPCTSLSLKSSENAS